MEEYKKWYRLWEYIRDLNQSDIFMYGWATHNKGGDIVVIFEEKDQRDNYKAAFPGM